MSNHLLVQLQRQHILLSYFKTLSVGPVWGSNPRPPAQQTGALPTELTRRRSFLNTENNWIAQTYPVLMAHLITCLYVNTSMHIGPIG